MINPEPGAATPADSWRGIPWMLATMVLFACINATAKYLTEFYPVPQVIWARYAFHLLAVAVILGPRLPGVMATRRLRLQLVRSVLLLLTTGLFFSGLSLVALADATAMMFVAPLLVTALSIPLLGESVGWRRWASVAVGFAGALIIIRPGMGVMQTAILLPLGAAMVHAVYQIATRGLGRTDSALTIIAYTPLVGALVTSAVVPFFWTAPDAKGWALMVLLGVLGGVGHFALIKAFQAAPASVVSPFGYTNLIWATVFGFIIWGHLPDMVTVLGATVIVAGGVYIFHREHIHRQPGHRLDPPD